jgi:hypothetical protein
MQECLQFGAVVVMSQWVKIGVWGLVTLLTAGHLQLPPTTWAQPAAPPEPAAVVLDDPVLNQGSMTAGRCQNGANLRQFAPDGLLFSTTAKCSDTATRVWTTQRVKGLLVQDAEVRHEFRITAGFDRLDYHLWFRDQGPGYYVALQPGDGKAQLRVTTLPATASWRSATTWPARSVGTIGTALPSVSWEPRCGSSSTIRSS